VEAAIIGIVMHRGIGGDVSTGRSPVLALAGVAGILVAIVAVSVISRYQIGPATPGSATPPIEARSPLPTATPTGAAVAASLPTIGPAFHETLPVVYIGEGLRVVGWAPDGSRFAVMDMRRSDSGSAHPAWTVDLFDRTGAAIGTVDAEDFAWGDSNRYVVVRSEVTGYAPGAAASRAYLGEIGSTKLMALGECDWLLAGPSGAVVLLLPWDGTISAPPYYRVVSNGNAGQPQPGYPVAWSRDGSALAVVHPNLATPSGFGGSAMGWLEVVGPTGQSLAAARNVETSVVMPTAAFSPDGSKIAFRDDTQSATKGEQIGILDLASGRLSRVPKFGPFTWATNDQLLFVDLSSSIPGENIDILSWSATTDQVATFHTGKVVGASGQGMVLTGTDTSGELSVMQQSQPNDPTWGPLVTLTLGAWPMGGIPDAAWSPDGRSLVLISGEPGLTYENAVLVQF
jgi:hypothetical protein